MTDTSQRYGNWGRFGDDDELGMRNLCTPDAVLAATQVPSTGKVYSLALPIQRHGVPWFDYRGAPTRLPLTHRADPAQFEAFGAPPHLGANEDVLILASHNETHIDALSHVFHENQMYNGFSTETVSVAGGATKLGIDKVRWIVGRAVLLDLPAFHGSGDWLEGPHVITSDEIERCAAHQGTEIRNGDILLVRTGWIDQFLSLNVVGPADVVGANPIQPGLGKDAVEFIDAHDIVAVGADNSAIESIPFDDDEFLGVHVELLVKRGVYLIEHLMLAEMAADRCYESLFMVAPLPVIGAAGSPVNPIAIG
ncbi:MAG: cyclase family protein [Acidimicrobiales bacterium]|nr:cyclase family protein [Acidimicrobiales bacterium]